MITVAVIGMVVLLLGAAAALRWREADDVHSVDHYHSTLHTLEEVREHVAHAEATPPDASAARRPGSAVHVLASSSHTTDARPGATATVDAPRPAAPDRSPAGDAAADEPTRPAVGSEGRSATTAGQEEAWAAGSTRPLFAEESYDDELTDGTLVVEAPGGGASGDMDVATDPGARTVLTFDATGSRADGDQGAPGDASGAATPGAGPKRKERAPMPGSRRDRAMNAMNHGPRHLGAPVAAVVAVVILVAVLIVVGATSKSATNSAARTPHRVVKAVPTTVAHHRTTRPTSPPHVTRPAAPRPPAEYTPASSSATSATYTPITASYFVSVVAGTGPCWVQIEGAGSGQGAGTVLFSGTLQPGQRETLPVAGSSTLELGAPVAASVSVNGSPVVLPAGYATPFTLTFTPVGEAG